MNKVQIGISVLKSRLLNTLVPHWVAIHLTNKCNLRCSYCYENYPSRKSYSMTYEQVKNIIDQLYSLGTYEICLSGGEPLLFNEFDLVVNHIKSKGIRCSLITNGHFIKEKLESVKKVDVVSISLDGTEEINDRVRGKGNYKCVINALEILNKEDIPISLKVTLHRHNLNSIDHIFELADRFNTLVSFGSMVLQSSVDRREKVVSKEIASNEEYKELGKKLLEFKKMYPQRSMNTKKSILNFTNWPVGYDKFMVLDSEKQSLSNFKFIKCRAGRNSVVIDTDGNVYPCSGSIGLLRSYNCIELGVQKALELASKHECHACHFFSSNDQNLIFSLDLGSIIHFLRIKR